MQHAKTDLVRLARRRAGAKLGFLIHLAVFIAVNALLFFISQHARPGAGWFAYPLGGWGIGLAIHGLVVWAASPGSRLRERMVADELARLEREHAPGASSRRG